MFNMTSIPATVSNVDGLQAELAEIDENLIRNELHFIEQGEQLLRRKEIYEELHPETKHGGDRKSKKIKSQDLALDPVSFVKDTAQKAGKSRSAVITEIQIARDLVPEAKAVVKAHNIPKTDALKLARMDAGKQKALAAKINIHLQKEVVNQNSPPLEPPPT